MIESDADRLAYVETLGELYQTSKGQILGIFSNGYVSTSGDADIEGTSPSLLVRTIDAMEYGKNDVIYADKSYRIDHKEPDESGHMTTLVLRL